MASYAEVALVQGMSYLSNAQSATAHNIANASTPGFKRRLAVAEQSVPTFASTLDASLPVARFTQVTSKTPGDVQATDDKLHIAIFDQNEYFALQRPDGSVYYSRNAKQLIDPATGNLTNDKGDVFLGPGSSATPIVLPTGDALPGSWTITPNGTIVDDDNLAVLGTIGIFREPGDRLVSDGRGEFTDPQGGAQALLPPGSGQLRQGAQERSNVDVTTELVNMLTIQRTFQAASRSLGALGRIQQAYVSAATT